MVALDDLRGLFQPQQFCISLHPGPSLDLGCGRTGELSPAAVFHCPVAGVWWHGGDLS